MRLLHRILANLYKQTKWNIPIEKTAEQLEAIADQHAQDFGDFIIKEKYTNSFNELMYEKKPELLTTKKLFEKFKQENEL